MSGDDLIRRGDVLYALAEPLHDRIRALPADPRSSAAVRLAEAAEQREAALADLDRAESGVGSVSLADARRAEAKAESEFCVALAAWRSLAKPEPAHSCQTHRATKGEANCGLTPCEEAMVHTPGETRPAKVTRKPEPAPSEKAPTISDERCGGVNCANPRCHYMVSCTQGLCDKCGTRVQPCPRCAPAPKCPEPCPTCGGSGLGEQWDHEKLDDAGRPTLKPCPRCAKGGSHD